MASRLLHPSRSSKNNDPRPADKPAKLSKRTSLSVASPTSSKIPLQSSSWMRPSTKKAPKPSPGSSVQQSQGATSRSTARREPITSTAGQAADRLAPGTPSARAQEMGNLTVVSSGSGTPKNSLRQRATTSKQSTELTSDPPKSIRHQNLQSQSNLSTAAASSPEPRSGSSATTRDPARYHQLEDTRSPVRMPPELAHLRSTAPPAKTTMPVSATTTPELKFPAPSFVRSNSASTRCTETPSPWSTHSTPTSVSSCSPGLSQIPKFGTRPQQSSPMQSRPPVVRRRRAGSNSEADEHFEEKGLPLVRELETPSSSSSVREQRKATNAQIMTKTKALQPPTPPPRFSSKASQSSPDIATFMAQERSLPPALPSKSPLSSSRGRNPGQTKLPMLNTSGPKIPPPRPSREGTPVLENARPSAVIQSNLTHLATTGHKRRESAEKILFGSPSKSQERDYTTSMASRDTSVDSSASRHALQIPVSASQAKASSPHLYSRESSQNRDTARGPASTAKLTKSDPKPLFASPTKSSSRFGLFSRKTRLPLEPTTTSNAEKPMRKGPPAGTGHEGYGKYARRGRSGSTSTAASRGRSTSTDRTSSSATRPASSRKSSFTSNDGTPELDDFLKDRLEPVFIGGGGKIRDKRNSGLGLYTMDSNQSSSTSLQSIAAPVQAPLAHEYYLSSTNVSADDLSTGPDVNSQYAAASDMSSEPHSTLAHRRSLHRLQLLGEAPPVRIPAPINTQALAGSPALDTYDSTLSSVPQSADSLPLTDDLSEGHEGNWLNPKKKMTAGKSKLRKWNIFHRPQRSSERPLDGPLDSSDSWTNLPIGVSTFGDPRPIAHYAIVDGFESDEPDNLEDALQKIEQNLDFDAEGEVFDFPQVPSSRREPSMLLPSPPKFTAQFEPLPRSLSPSGITSHPSDAPQPSPDKPPRLQQVGRIPRILPKRERSFHPSPQSFSRPFARRAEPQPESTADMSVAASTATIERPVLGVQTDLIPAALFSDNNGYASMKSPTNGMLYNLDGEREFLRFSRRQDSETSESSGSAILNLAPITAFMPTPDDVLSEDEVWGEYDDLIDHVASPSSASPRTPGASQAVAWPNAVTDELATGIRSATETEDAEHLRSAAEAAARRTNRPVLPPRPSYLMAPNERDQLSSPLSLSDLYAGYGNRSSAAKSTTRYSNASTISGSRYSSQTIISESASPDIENCAHMKRVTQVLAEKTYNASSDSLRFSALMTSRWLCFDRVLFSPVQAELRSSRQDRILVVDGLENDDWSTYCALTYPESNVYNLCSSLALNSRKNVEVSNADRWMNPSNHRRISYASIAAPFPFPKGFFTAVVLRFPAADTDYAYRNAIAECKRVLRPGGYLELTILDMDMVNMGQHVSRAIRNLKVRMRTALPDVNLSPTSDEIIKLLGRKGFESISRCVVGVPVTGAVSDSRSGSMSDSQQTASLDREADIGAQLSLGALLAGQAQGADLHYPVTKMVARVARWWWSKCYETSILGEPRENMWSNKQLLRECEERQTGLKLVVCYAQKPISARRRTVSV